MSARSLTIVVLFLSPWVVRAADEENPFKTAKLGDFAKYNTVIKSGSAEYKTVRTQTVTAVGEKELTLKTVTELNGKEVPTKLAEQKIDLTKPFDPAPSEFVPGGGALKWEKLKDGKEKLKVGDKEYDCTWTTYKPTVPDKVEVEGELKVWMSKDVPFVVKRTLKMKFGTNELNYTTELIEFGNKK